MVSGIVGGLPALKYFEAASSYCFQTSSTGCRQETSACVCTSIATRSWRFMPWGSCASVPYLVPVRERTPLAHQAHEQWRRLPVHRPEQIPVLEDALEHCRKPDRVGVEQRAAAVARKAVAGGPHDVDVTGAQRDTLLQDANAFIDDRQQAALEDLGVAMRSLRDIEPRGGRPQDFHRLRVIVPGAICRLVAIVAFAALLPEPTGRMQRDIGLVVARIRRVAIGVRPVDIDADVDARHVEYRQNAHRHAPVFQSAIHLPRRGSLE